MEYTGSLHRTPTVESDDRPSAPGTGDSSNRGDRVSEPLLYTSAVPAARMQIITRPLSGLPADIAVKLSSQERSRFIVAGILTALFVGLLVFTLVAGTGAPDLGINVLTDSQGQKVVSSVLPYAAGHDQGVVPGDVVLNDTQSGDVRTLTIAKQSGPPLVITSDATPLTAWQRWSYIILALVFIGIGGPVYVKARHRVAASAFYAFCTASAIALLIAPLTSLGYGWAVLMMFLSLMVWSGCFAFFFLKFPVRAGKTRRRHRFLVSSVYVGGFITIGAYLLIFNFDISEYGFGRLLGYAYIAFCVLLGLASLGIAFVKEHSAEVRQQMTIVLGGTALAVVPSLLLGILPSMMSLPNVAINETALTLGFMPLSFAYAITQGQMLGVRNFIRRGVVYVLMGFSVLLAFSVAGITLGAILPAGWLNSEVGLISVSFFVFLLAISYGYLQRHVERLVDKYIYHDAYDYKEALLQFSAQLAAEQNLSTLADELVQRTCRMMNLTCGVLLLAAPLDKETETQTELLLQDMGAQGGHVTALWNSLNGDRTVDIASNGSGPSTGSPDKNGTGEKDLLRVIPYARYGDFADWLIEGLHYELSQLGIRLDQPDSPMQLIYFNQGAGEQDGVTDTQKLRTQLLSENSLITNTRLTSTGTLSNRLRTGSLGGHIATAPAHVASATTTGTLHPTKRLDLESIRSFLGVPLWTRSHFAGVLCLGGKRTGERFTKDDLSLLGTLGSQAALAIHNAQLYEAREQALLDTIGALAHAIEAKDGYTIQHCENMTGRALALAQAMGLPTKEVENIRMGAILHDIGKIGIPDAVLNKPAKLTNEEYELMKQHAAIGARIVQSVGALQGVVPIVRYHQERYDGSGYPEGLKGEEIPIGARIIGVVDTYGAMTEDRVYRATPGHDKAIAELQRLAGRQFDPTVVEAFIQLLEERPDLAELRDHIA